ncbi:MAG: hypothetical protein KF900_04065 [Bacteroidetes bacterium]|nr:hypothetical protein [Bacteroidota bacterium]
MKKVKLKLGATIVACALTTGLIVVSCKKDKTYTANNETTPVNAKNGKIKSLQCSNLSGKQVLQMVKTFKQSSQNAAKTSSLDVEDALPLDSAEFLIEATLNYDFDYHADSIIGNEEHSDTFTFTTMADGRIAVDEMQRLYSVMGSAISDYVSADRKIAVVDLETFTEAGGGHFELTTVVIKGPIRVPFPPALPPCGFPIGATVYALDNPTTINNQIGCTYVGNPVNAAPIYRNCLECLDPDEICTDINGYPVPMQTFYWGVFNAPAHRFIPNNTQSVPSTPYLHISQLCVNGNWNNALYFYNSSGNLQFSNSLNSCYNFFANQFTGFVRCDNTFMIDTDWAFNGAPQNHVTQCWDIKVKYAQGFYCYDYID